jgi:hypothetical protein
MGAKSPCRAVPDSPEVAINLSFSDKLAIGALVLTIVLLVLDKAGKLKGPALLALLGIAAFMAVPLALSNSWVAGAPSGMMRFGRAMLLISAIGAIYAVIAIWIAPDSVAVIPTQTESATPSEQTAVIAPPPPSLMAMAYDASYPAKTEIGGILWNSKYYDVRVIVSNHTDDDYLDVDLTTRTNGAIAKVGEVTRSGCRLMFADPVDEDLHLESVNQRDGTRTANPLTLIAFEGKRRIRCNILERRSRIELVMAAVSIDMNSLRALPNHGTLEENYVLRVPMADNSVAWYAHKRPDEKTAILFGRRTPVVTQVQVSGSYRVGDKTFPVSQILEVNDLVKEGIKKIPRN